MENAHPPLERESSLSRLNRVLSAGADLTADKENISEGAGKGRFMTSTASSRKKEALGSAVGGRVAPVAEDGEEAPPPGCVRYAATTEREAPSTPCRVAAGGDGQ